MTVATADTDENHLLGRPGQYIGKANWHDPRDDAPASTYSIEVFATADDLSRRLAYLKEITQRSSLFCEYDFAEGLVLLRISCHLSPSTAAAYDAALKRAGR